MFQSLDLFAKCFDVLKVPVHRCVAHIGHFIELVQFFHDDLTDLARRHFALAETAQLTRDVADRLFHGPIERGAGRGPIEPSVGRGPMEPSVGRGPMEPSVGLGIGLYNTANLARQAGYTLALTSNRDGDVCFSLVRAEGLGDGEG